MERGIPPPATPMAVPSTPIQHAFDALVNSDAQVDLSADGSPQKQAKPRSRLESFDPLGREDFDDIWSDVQSLNQRKTSVGSSDSREQRDGSPRVESVASYEASPQRPKPESNEEKNNHVEPESAYSSGRKMVTIDFTASQPIKIVQAELKLDPERCLKSKIVMHPNGGASPTRDGSSKAKRLKRIARPLINWDLETEIFPKTS